MGAHKEMLFTTSGFQSGAIKYAKAHGIALVSIIGGVAAQRPVWLNLPKLNEAGNISMKSLGRADTEINEMFS